MAGETASPWTKRPPLKWRAFRLLTRLPAAGRFEVGGSLESYPLSRYRVVWAEPWGRPLGAAFSCFGGHSSPPRCLCLLQSHPGDNGQHQQDCQTGRQPVHSRVSEKGGEDERHHRGQNARRDERGRRNAPLTTATRTITSPGTKAITSWPTHNPPAASIPEVMKEAIEPKVTGRTMISSDVAPARLLAATAQVTGRLSVTVKDLFLYGLPNHRTCEVSTKQFLNAKPK